MNKVAQITAIIKGRRRKFDLYTKRVLFRTHYFFKLTIDGHKMMYWFPVGLFSNVSKKIGEKNVRCQNLKNEDDFLIITQITGVKEYNQNAVN